MRLASFSFCFLSYTWHLSALQPAALLQLNPLNLQTPLSLLLVAQVMAPKDSLPRNVAPLLLSSYPLSMWLVAIVPLPHAALGAPSQLRILVAPMIKLATQL
ncbi:hypothetical protein GOP47_0010847 [Adiantum capillus-veneris]|uniref:Secreted protein n=1 Tax=Adiantum capillus-veneris TaxID=13818 RepID=A0A9D4UVT4_ADICA|nr:hypothetical protein GOP47_0010847 [Adiantum capillus-veneris]